MRLTQREKGSNHYVRVCVIVCVVAHRYVGGDPGKRQPEKPPGTRPEDGRDGRLRHVPGQLPGVSGLRP